MKTLSLLEKLFIIGLAIIFAGIVVHAPLSVWLGVQYPDLELIIKSWKEILMSILAVIAYILVTQKKLWPQLSNDWLFRAIVAYALLHVLLVPIFFESMVATLFGLAVDLRYILFFSLTYVAVRLFPAGRRLFVPIAIIGAFVVTGFATLQLFLPPDILSHIGYSISTIQPYLTVDQNPEYIRVNSTLRGPNPLGAYIVTVLAGITAYAVGIKLKWRLNKQNVVLCSLVVCSIVALWITYSRSALIGAIVAAFIVLAATILRRIPRAAWIMGIVVVFILVGGLVINRNSQFISNVIFHDNPTSGGNITSNDGHVESLADGFNRMVRQPLGGGIGSTGSASLESSAPLIIENQYLFIAHEAGWLGLLLFMCIFIVILVRVWRRRTDWLALAVFASGISLGLIGLLQPVWVDDTVSIIWWGLAAVALAGGQYGRKTSKQKAA